ncbi:3-chlorobenzoate-3,4-dioxygenase reductase subunit [Paraphaeosphaeria sporulosa]|uniref:3-chlorobenzoate-3,4-dioxygenase reductase subunit n=1 Tax=Paraphaeosphaeria sporulosa TaxID=1460663 RepID=A0A177BZM5_9PLEO|nr:3-chlorobenzoate-3,4-dioxygenase reductase subunit [Paraphaeosphaeria sporulosa]OAF99997.1 3-chlorobenzoate-3,4-dioxygenase reductase subunit [Paraphaeosphaeria sporulosa]
MAIAPIPWTPPQRPDPEALKDPPPFEPIPLVHLRSGKIRSVFNKAGMTSAIHKSPLAFPVTIAVSGIVGDEHAYLPHRDPDKAIHHYSSAHYYQWAAEIPESAHIFRPGAFGENLFSDELDETKLCIGDKVRMGGVLLEVSEPRAPCYKLNHRFQVKNMANRVQTLLRSGWLYRVLQPGVVEEGAMIELVERVHPEWSVARVAYYLFLERDNKEMNKEIAALAELGHDIKDRFKLRLEKNKLEDEAGRLFGGEEEKMDTWNEYRLVEKRRETGAITAFVFEAVEATAEQDIKPVEPGSHVRVKLGGKLVRAYSVVGGTTKRFELGIALEAESRGGSKYMHTEAKIDDILTFSRITCSFPLAKDADKHIIIAGGIGITAFLAAAEFFRATKQKYELHFAVSSEVPFAAQIEALGSSAKVYNKSLGQRLDLGKVIAGADPTAHIYSCGPQRLMDAVASVAKEHGMPDRSVHFEQFVVATSGDPFTAELKQSGKTLEVGPTQSLLDVLRTVGMDIDSSCEVGNCGTCRVDVCSGRVEHRGTGLADDEKKESMLSCVSRGIGRIILDL